MGKHAAHKPLRWLTLAAVLSGLGLLISVVAASAAFGRSAAAGYVVRNLVSDQPGAAEHQDSNLVNAWGIAAGPTPWWVANNGTDTSTLYDANGNAVPTPPLVVSVEGAPTGTVFNGSSGFVVSDGNHHSGPAAFLFATEAGTIRGWSPAVPPPPLSTKSFIVVNRAGHAIYKGLAISGNKIYAADFHNARVDVFDDTFKPVVVPGAFTDPNLPKGYAPFGIQAIGDRIYVTYAKQDADAEDEIAGPGFGFVDSYDVNGGSLVRVASGGDLNAPWGVAWAPVHGFGPFNGDLLIGNFGDGKITAFKRNANGTFSLAGQLRTPGGQVIVIDGLWGIGFGNGAAAGPVNVLYFAAGPDDESHGLFGRIDASS